MNTLVRSATLLLLVCLMAGHVLAAGGFMTTVGGVEYKDLKPGTGERAEVGDVATIQFAGWLEEKGGKGRELYDTHTRGDTVSFVIGTDKVMQGWNEGVIGMRPGGKRLVKVPPELGYGSRGVQDVVPPNARLIFVIELLELQKQ
jgi:FKBP-type peptidyl-prolyl cis-trans isomerase